MNAEQFWASAEGDDNGCMVWQRAKQSAGYGNVRWNMRWRTAHTVAYEIVHGSIPEGMELDHLCRNRACINIEHLEAVTRKTNILRGMGPTARNARKTHCSHGHEFTPENTYRSKSGHRQCVTCRGSVAARAVLAPSQQEDQNG